MKTTEQPTIIRHVGRLAVDVFETFQSQIMTYPCVNLAQLYK